MYAIFYFIVLVTCFHKFKCNRARVLGDNRLKANEIENDMKMIMKPLKKLSGIFPNHDIEVQFDIEHTRYHPTGPVGLLKSLKQVRLDNSAHLNSQAFRTNAFGRLDIAARRASLSTPLSIKEDAGVAYKDLPINGIRRSNDLTSSATTTSPTTVSATTPLSSLDPDKKIVYMNDLNKALEGLEKKLLKGINGEKYCNQEETKNEMPLPSKISLDNPTLLNIVNSLKKNGPLQKDSKPSDEDLSWIKIKLPV